MAGVKVFNPYIDTIDDTFLLGFPEVYAADDGKPAHSIVIKTDKNQTEHLKEMKPTLIGQRLCFPKHIRTSEYLLDRYDHERLNELKQLYPADKIFDIIKLQFDYFIDFPEEELYYIFPLWIIGTYMFPIFNSYPYIELFGGAGTGKTKTLELCSLLAFNGRLSVGISPSAIFRGTERFRWALFLDEADLFRPNTNDTIKRDIIAFLKSGYKKGINVMRSEKTANDRYDVREFETYCPKMFATNYETEQILATRQIQVIMRPAKFSTGRGQRQPNTDSSVLRGIRTELFIFALKHAEEIRKIYQNMENELNLPNRDYELWKPLLAIATWFKDANQLYGEDFTIIDKIKTFIIRKISEKKETAGETVEYFLLRTIWNIGSWNEYCPFSDIVHKIQDEYEPVPDFLTRAFLGRLIKRMNIPFIKRRMGRGFEYRFQKAEIEDMIERYGFQKILEPAPEPKKEPEKPEYEENIKLRAFMKDVEKAKMED